MTDDIIDRAALNRLLETVGGDTGFLAELINTFIADTSAQLSAMQQAVTNDDAEGLRRAAHTLKSNSANLGALNLSQTCKELETMAKSNALDGAAALISRIENEYEQAKRALQNARDGKS